MEWIGQVNPTPSDSSSESGKMKLSYFSNEFPHDDLKELLRHLHTHSKSTQYPTLARFIHEATLAIRDEVRSLPTTVRELIPPFGTIFNLADHATLRNGPLGGAIDGMFLCAVQLATLIGYYENSPQEDFDFQSVDVCLAGLGTGLLSTAAVSLSPTLADVPLAGAHVLRVAFRLGILVNEVSQNLKPRQSATEGGSGDSWAYVVSEISVDEVQRELDAIHLIEKTPEASKIFISALSRTSVTVSGPPARLKHMFHVSEFFRDSRYAVLPVYAGLCHAKHVYTKQHVESIVEPGNASLESLNAKFLPRVPIYSTGTGKPFDAKNATELFTQIITAILTQAIQWDNVIEGVVQKAKDIGASECVVLVSRTSLPIHDLVAAFKASKLPQFRATIKDLVPWMKKSDTSPGKPRGTAQSKIAIVGMACRLPGGADDTERFWEVLDRGLDLHRKIPADRFDVDTHYDPSGNRMNASHTPYGCFINEPGLFDASFFNMTDPMQRLALVTAYEALERAGYVANRTAATNLNRIGTYYAQASDDYREVNSAQEISTYFITGGCRAFGPGRINYFFKFAGPSYSIDTACSSGLATIQTACTSLWNGDIDTAVAGGMNVLTNSDAFAGLSHGHFLSKTPNACKTWDAEADGYCRADGVGSLVMKRLEDAEADNDNILGVILGAGTNHSADAISITHPHAGAQAYLTRQVISQAGVDPLDVSFVESTYREASFFTSLGNLFSRLPYDVCLQKIAREHRPNSPTDEAIANLLFLIVHGTGTQAGDAQEIISVTDVFAPIALTKRRSSKQPLYIGAVKANIGHGEAVAGTAAVLKVLLMFQKEAIPRHVGIKTTINPAFPKDLDKRNLRIPYKKQPWPRVIGGKKRIAVVNNFSAAGGNTSVTIEEAPIRETSRGPADPRSTHLVTVSAKSKASLKGNLVRMIAYLEANPHVSLKNLAYTTTARRSHHNQRVAVATSEVAHLKKQLVSQLQSVDSLKPIPSTGPPPVVFAFTGQGASDRSQNLELFRDSSYFRSQLLYLDFLSQGQGFPSFVPAIDGSHAKDYAHSPIITQLALVCTEIALAKYWESLGVRPDVVVGHSLGEYAAIHVAGVLSASDTIFLVGQRALMLEERCQVGSHKMLAVRASLADIHESTGENHEYEIACINGWSDTVLSGTESQIDAVTKILENAGFKCFKLDTAFAFHSGQMDPILDEFEQIARTGVLFQAPTLPIISPVLGKVIFDEKTINGNYLRQATRKTVNFLSAIETANKISTIDETMVWVEIGPHPVCTGLSRCEW